MKINTERINMKKNMKILRNSCLTILELHVKELFSSHTSDKTYPFALAINLRWTGASFRGAKRSSRSNRRSKLRV